MPTTAVTELVSYVYDTVWSPWCDNLSLCKTHAILAKHQVFQGIINSKKSNWFKLKRDYMNTGNLADSLDLVVVGADWGKGKRTGVFGSFLVACYDEETGGL